MVAQAVVGDEEESHAPRDELAWVGVGVGLGLGLGLGLGSSSCCAGGMPVGTDSASYTSVTWPGRGLGFGC